MALECEAHEQAAIVQTDAASLAHAPHQEALAIDDRSQPFREAPLSFPVAAGGRLVADRLMRALAIVDLQPGVEAPLHGAEIGKAFARDHLAVERAVEALVLALRLG